MAVRLAPGTSARDLVVYLRVADEQKVGRRDVLGVLTERFGLSFDDARLAMDRAGGGAVRAASANPANEPDPVKDPLAWVSYRFALGLLVDEYAPWPSAKVRASAEALLERARRGEPTQSTKDVAVALEVARLAVASQEPDRSGSRVLRWRRLPGRSPDGSPPSRTRNWRSAAWLSWDASSPRCWASAKPSSDG